MEKITPESANALFQAILQLKSVEECHAFFEDLCTIKELQDIAQRFEVAQMLYEKKNYQEISRKTGASTATICRVGKCLNYGSGGYRAVLDRCREQEK
jgi:TrpR-related protein YerC/YecD